MAKGYFSEWFGMSKIMSNKTRLESDSIGTIKVPIHVDTILVKGGAGRSRKAIMEQIVCYLINYFGLYCYMMIY